MKHLTAFITVVCFVLGLSFFFSDIQADSKSPLAGKLFADRKDKSKISHEEKEEMLKKKEAELSQKEEAPNKKEVELKAWEQRLKSRARVRKAPRAATTPGVVNLQSPRTTGPVAPSTPAPAPKNGPSK
jgi:hypothetical protein